MTDELIGCAHWDTFQPNLDITACINYCGQSGSMCQDDMTIKAALNGRIDVLHSYREKGIPMNGCVAHYAAMGGHVECLDYTVKHGFPLGDQIAMGAASSGKLECLKYCYTQGLHCDHHVVIAAAKYGRFDCLRYYHENIDKSFYTAAYHAAMNGHFKCLRYCLDHGGDWGFSIAEKTLVEYAPMRSVQYIFQNGHLSDADLQRMCKQWDDKTQEVVLALPTHRVWTSIIRMYMVWNNEMRKILV